MTTLSITNHERAVEQQVSRLLPEPKTKTQTAIEYVKHGLSVIPTNYSKKPTLNSWHAFQSHLPDVYELSKWWYNNDASMAIICGEVSGHLECIDFDEKYNIAELSLFERWLQLVREQNPELTNKLVVQTTQNKGFHVIYRCSTIEGNQKLAQRYTTSDEKREEPNLRSRTLIETRGEGGYILCYPSSGYSISNGSLLSIPMINPEERALLLQCARMMNEIVSEADIVKANKVYSGKNRPGDVFNKAGDHKKLLVKHGWTYSYESSIHEHWIRPGKTGGTGATYHKEKGLFYVWSSNALPLEMQKAYTKFTLYAALETNNDYREAAKKLASEGFGEAPDVETSGAELQKIETYLSEHYQFRRNVVTSRVEFMSKDGQTYNTLRDIEQNSLFRELKKKDFAITIDTLGRLLNSDYVSDFDPFVSYFENLPAWDGVTDYIGILAKTVKLESANENDLFKHNLRKWLIGVVACAIEPNHINQTMVVLVGEQGIGKGRWLKRLMPLSISRYYFEGIIKTDNKDTLVNLSECLLINLDELETLNKTDIGELKSLITRTSVKVRRPYDRLQEDLPRRASFVGSVNPTDFLNDPTGTRRFLAFQVVSIDLEAMPNMDLVFAQAFALYRQGIEWWFNEKEIGDTNSRNMKFSAQGYEEQLILSMYEKPESGKGTWMTSTEIAESISVQYTSFKVDRQSVRNIGIALTKHGFVFKRPGNVKTYEILLKK